MLQKNKTKQKKELDQPITILSGDCEVVSITPKLHLVQLCNIEAVMLFCSVLYTASYPTGVLHCINCFDCQTLFACSDFVISLALCASTMSK